MTSEVYEDVWVLPFKSQEFVKGPELHQTLGELHLLVDHEKADGSYEWSGIVFRGVHAFMFTGHGSCSPDQVHAYDRLVRVHQSDWLAHLKRSGEQVHHYRIYFDYIGAYDIAASEVEVKDRD